MLKVPVRVTNASLHRFKKRPRIYLPACVGALLFLSVTVSAQVREVLTLERCIALALENSELIKITAEGVVAAKGMKQEAFGRFLPSLDMAGSYTQIPEVPEIMGFKMGDEDNYSAKLTLAQPLFTWGKIRQGYRQAGLRHGIAAETYRKDKNEMVLNVKKMFYAVLLSGQIKNISEEARDVMKRHYEVTQALYREGKVSNLDVSRVKVQMINSSTRLIKAENELVIAKKALLNLINYCPDDDWEAESKLPDISGEDSRPMAELVSEAIKSRPEMKNASSQKEIAKCLVKLARAQNRPNLALIGNYEYTKPYNFVNEWDSSWNVTCALTFPLFNGLSNFGRIQQAKAGLQQTTLGENLLKKNIKLEVEKAELDRRNAAERVEAQKENVKTAKENMDIVQKRYEQGLVSDLELRDTQLALTQAETEYSTALFDLNIAQAELEKAIGE
ncbi:MAG: TolC family protein [bacterium]